jgi:hypothetical protein
VSCDFIESMITAKNVPRSIIYRATTILFNRVLSTEENSSSDTTTARRLLSQIQQRHPAILENVAEELREAGESSQEAVEQIVISLSIVSFYFVSVFGIELISIISLFRPLPLQQTHPRAAVTLMTQS